MSAVRWQKKKSRRTADNEVPPKKLDNILE